MEQQPPRLSHTSCRKSHIALYLDLQLQTLKPIVIPIPLPAIELWNCAQLAGLGGGGGGGGRTSRVR